MEDFDDNARPDCAAGALLVDDEGGVLLVEPTFRSTWEIPVGHVARGETPREACVRALGEQFGHGVPVVGTGDGLAGTDEPLS